MASASGKTGFIQPDLQTGLATANNSILMNCRIAGSGLLMQSLRMRMEMSCNAGIQRWTHGFIIGLNISKAVMSDITQKEITIKEIKPLHCQNVLNQMSAHYSNSVIDHSRLVMRMLFDSAVENELLAKNPVTKSVNVKAVRSQRRCVH